MMPFDLSFPERVELAREQLHGDGHMHPMQALRADALARGLLDLLNAAAAVVARWDEIEDSRDPSTHRRLVDGQLDWAFAKLRDLVDPPLNSNVQASTKSAK
jgi:hypothetical protein